MVGTALAGVCVPFEEPRSLPERTREPVIDTDGHDVEPEPGGEVAEVGLLRAKAGVLFLGRGGEAQEEACGVHAGQRNTTVSRSTTGTLDRGYREAPDLLGAREEVGGWSHALAEMLGFGLMRSRWSLTG